MATYSRQDQLITAVQEIIVSAIYLLLHLLLTIMVKWEIHDVIVAVHNGNLQAKVT